MSTLEEINNSLKASGIDPADLTKIIADIKAAVATSFEGILADKDKQLADKDTAHEATLARLKDEHAAAKKTADDSLAAIKATYADDLAKLKAESDADNGMSKTLLEGMTKERDDLAGQLAALKDGQTKLAHDFAGKVKTAQDALAGIVPALEAALAPAQQKAKEANAARKAALLAEAAAIPD